MHATVVATTNVRSDILAVQSRHSGFGQFAPTAAVQTSGTASSKRSFVGRRQMAGSGRILLSDGRAAMARLRIERPFVGSGRNLALARDKALLRLRYLQTASRAECSPSRRRR